MNLLLLGATGRVGKEILKLAERDGHQVTAFVRTPEKSGSKGPNVRLFKGDARNKQDVERAMKGQDAVISALNTDKTTTLSEATSLLIDAMKKENVERIITVGTAGILQSRTDPDILRYRSSESKRKSTAAAEEHEKAYRLLEHSNLAWTIVCPTYLPDGEATGSFRAEKNVLPVDGKKISVGDTAAFTYSQLTDSGYLRTRVGISY
ncbi:NAD(P)-dependent oxidoreductase [Pseudalkalibacillus caeni]|uniref:SDR family oxidoreductase n=1 Tax=Exobacillus caeni TaxID=2574798 RepID=A0A5R9FE99_9BACL|nr:SDR family oxidoreductase [Pseudalkalibacillus caeni]TLS37945.1 SDR family oxidoreductase [Pseudalkalibacillus caeni]